MPENKEISWRDRERFTSGEVNAKMVELGIPTEFPKDTDFSAVQIRKEISELADSYLWEDTVVMKGTDYAPEVIIAFANLATKLQSKVTLQYGDLKVRKETTAEQRREFALAHLKSRLSQGRKDDAIRVLIEENPVEEKDSV